jgi:hypothetical protein
MYALDLFTFLTTATNIPVPAPDIPADSAPNLQYLGILVPAVGAFLIALTGLVSNVWRRRQDRKDALEDKNADANIAAQPKITDGWEEVRKARLEATLYYNLYRAFENIFYTVFGAFKHLVRDTRNAHPDHEFSKDILDALKVDIPDTSEPAK